MISMREVFNLFSFDSVVQVKRSCYFTDYQFRRPTTSIQCNRLLNIKHYITLRIIIIYSIDFDKFFVR